MEFITFVAIVEGGLILILSCWLYACFRTIEDLTSPKLTKEQRRSKK